MGPGLGEWFENVRISLTQGNKMNCDGQVPLNRNRGGTLLLLTNGARFISLSQCELLYVAHQNPGFESTTELYIWDSSSWNILNWSLRKFLPKLLRLQEAVSRFYTLYSFACMVVQGPYLPRIYDELW